MGANESYEVSNKIFTLPNLISFIRLLMIPIFLVLLFHDLNLAATLLFAIAASTDWGRWSGRAPHEPSLSFGSVARSCGRSFAHDLGRARVVLGGAFAALDHPLRGHS